ncbi:hypothetical protein DFH28DRAFT_1123189 [Melampsora americana]|nr:hypothetical protein DFH28DRAFT_1123189 [Melampsora americana]
MRYSGHPHSCWTCIAAGVNCSWVIVNLKLLRACTKCNQCDGLEIVCEWTALSPPPKKTPNSSSTTYVKGDDNETEEQCYQHIQAWLFGFPIFESGGMVEMPLFQLKFLHQLLPPYPPTSNVNLDPPSPPAISSDHEYPSPPKKPRNIIHKTSKNKNKNKNKKFFNHPHSKVFTCKPSPDIVLDSPVEIKPNFSTTIEDLIETPPPSPPAEFDNSFPPSSEPFPSTSTSND